MIPTIGLMIGSYIIFRCVEVLCRAGNSFVSTAGRTTIQVMAVLLILLTGSLIYHLYNAVSLVSIPGLGR
jgi:hypothetical protein